MTRRQRIVRTAFWAPITVAVFASMAHSLITYSL